MNAEDRSVHLLGLPANTLAAMQRVYRWAETGSSFEDKQAVDEVITYVATLRQQLADYNAL